MAKWDQSIVEQVFRLHHITGYTQSKISYITGVPPRTVSNWLNDAKNIELYSDLLLHTDTSRESDGTRLTDGELQTQNITLAKKVQRLQDANRIERKSFRESARVDNTLEALTAALLSVVKENTFTNIKSKTKKKRTVDDAPIGVVQFSDVHFNELIDDIDGNVYNFEIASQRVRKHVLRSISYFKAHNVTDIAVFFTGDMLNSDRRLDEITNAATNRSKAIFLAVDILQQGILELAEDFNVTVASITGNESRVGEHIHWTNFLASDSYDLVIHNMLTYLLKGAENVTFIPITNPLEQVINLNGTNFLLVHGHGHGYLASTGKIESGVVAIKAKYASRGVQVDYVICGHVHSALVSDNFSRSSGMPGNNAYSERALNLNGKASQNLFLVWKDKSIDGIKVDLQHTNGIDGYPFDHTLESYAPKNGIGNSTVIIQSVLI